MNAFNRMLLFFVALGFLAAAISVPSADSLILNFKDLGGTAQTLFSWMFYGIFATLVIMAGGSN